MSDWTLEGETSIRRQLERRRSAVAERWDLRDEIVLIGAGAPIVVSGRGDVIYPFRAHSEYFYLTDRDRPGGILAFDPEEGWVDFVAPVTKEERLWEGAHEGTADGPPVDELDEWLATRGDRPVAWLGTPLPGAEFDVDLASRARAALNHVRRQKDEVELDRMRAAERATKAGFAALVDLIEPGRTERELQIELEAEFFRNGADAVAFHTIVGSGPNSAVLHFAPTRRRLEAGELLLVDAGGEVRGYASDVTRTYPASGAFTAVQADLHALVRSACETATELCRVGTVFTDVHLAGARVIAEGLADFGVLRGDAENLVEGGAVALFFPHGIGHMVGLGIRDAGELLNTKPERKETLERLRIDLELLSGHVVTIEPGIYFVPALLADRELRERHRDSVDWDRAEAMIGFGGIRIEDNVLITETGNEVLTSDIPVSP